MFKEPLLGIDGLTNVVFVESGTALTNNVEFI